MIALRKISGISRWHQWQYHITNEEIRNRLSSVNIQEKVSESNLRWFGHLNRMEDTRLPKQLFEAKVKGVRPRGRPHGKWLDSVKEGLDSRGLNVATAEGLNLIGIFGGR